MFHYESRVLLGPKVRLNYDPGSSNLFPSPVLAAVFTMILVPVGPVYPVPLM